MRKLVLALVAAALAAGPAVSAESQFSAERMRAHVAFLSDDLLEGREPGTRGYDIAARYVAAQFAQMGLKPGGEDGGWYQQVPLVESRMTGPRATVIPQLAAQTERTARIRLEQGGLRVLSVSEIRSTAFPADTVVAQNPPAATLAPGVSLLINRAEEAAVYVMPDVIGIDGSRAADTLRRQGLRVSVVGR